MATTAKKTDAHAQSAATEEVLDALRVAAGAGVDAVLRAALAPTAESDEARAVLLAAFETSAQELSECVDVLETLGDAQDAMRVARALSRKLSDFAEALAAGESIAPQSLHEAAGLAGDKLKAALNDRIEEKARLAAAQGDAASSSTEARAIIDSAVDEIDQISLNVRLISLNASVEAARAGAAGRGFGVIAMEIQNLATRSQSAVESVRRQLASIG